MKLNVAFTTLASFLSFAAAAPNVKYQYRRQIYNDTGSGVGAIGQSSIPFGNNSTTAPGGGAGVGAINTGLTTQTVVSTVTTTISQQYTTFLSTSLATATLVFPAGTSPNAGSGAGALPAGGSSSGSSPVDGTSPNAGSGAGALPAGGSSSGSSPVDGSSPAVIAGSVGANGVCQCSVPTVVATGVYTATVVQAVNLGTASYTTTFATSTIGILTIAGGSIIAAQPTITQTATVASNPSAALAPGEAYQTIVIPASGSSPAYEIVVVVQTVTPVVAPVNGDNPNGDGVGAIGQTTSSTPLFSNSTMTSTSSFFPSSTLAETSISSGVGAGVGPAQTATSSGLVNPVTTTTPATPGATQAPGTNAVQVGSLGTTPLYNQAAFINDMLNIHNEYRARHGAPAMTWSDDLATTALANVNTNAADGTFLHSIDIPALSSDPYGENIALEYGQNNPDYLVYLWYEEINNYNYDDPVFAEETGHFTQLVWDASTELGCAFTQASDVNGTYYLACEYNAPGNVDGEYSANVNPLLANQPAVVEPSGNVS